LAKLLGRVAANSGNPGKVMEFCEVWKKSWKIAKSHGIPGKVMENGETQLK